MEVEKEPSPWPIVMMLAALLVCCLVAPQYWQQAPKPATANTDALFDDAYRFGTFGGSHSFNENGYASTVTQNTNNFNLPAVPSTIAGFNADPNTASQFNGTESVLSGPSFNWQPIVIDDRSSTTANSPNVDEAKLAAEIEVRITIWMEIVGVTLADWTPSTVLTDLIAQVVDIAPTYIAAWPQVTPLPGPEFTSRPNIYSNGADDRFAMLPAAPKQTPWCVPQTLFDQISRLAEPQYTAQWASQVNNQLHALTERSQLEGDDVQLILADLGEAAQEALRLSDTTDDDRLRVELLRAHWALARRLDCWSAMHEEHVAFRVQGHVAARGDLSPYFDNAPSRLPCPAEIAELSRNLEQYERTGDPRMARDIINQQRTLAASPASYDRTLAEAVEQHYRNANVRIAITAGMVNRLTNSERTETRPVVDNIAGAAVRGQSEIYSKSEVRLAPANDEWHLRVQTNGVVESNTVASAGPVRLRNISATEFSGDKSVIIRPDGVQLQPTDISANHHARLMGVTSDYDWMPMFGNVARDRAMDQYQARKNYVREMMEARVSSEASDRIDQDTHDAMERARKRLYDRFTERFNQYGLKLTTVQMQSSPERLVARMRIGSDEQLGSHTPRPRALSDSLASMQLHESAMNNMAITLGLDGQHLTGPELQAKLHERFPQIAERKAEDVRRDIVFQFVPQNAVQFRIADGKLELKVLFDSVELDGQAMPNVIVHAGYTPDVAGLNADLKRDGALGIEGRLSAGERASLHNVFKTVFPPERKLRLAHLNDDNDGRLKGLMITQLVLEDGWLGVAIGPESTNRVAERFRSLR